MLGDIIPTNPSIYDEEFEGTADVLPTDWSIDPVINDELSINSHWPSLFAIEGAGNTPYILRRENFAPEGDFAIFAKVFAGPHLAADNPNLRFYLRDAGETNAMAIEFYSVTKEEMAVRGLQLNNGSESIAFGAVRSLGKGQTHVYMGLMRQGNDWKGFYSVNGVAWEQLGSVTSKQLNISKMYFTLKTTNQATFAGIDWVRFRDTLTFPRPF